MADLILPGNATTAEQASSEIYQGSNGLVERWATGINKAEHNEAVYDWMRNEASAEKARQFSHDEAALNRQWQEMMSNTAMQRAMKDYEAAGLSPLAAIGNSASTPAGSMAETTAGRGSKASMNNAGAGFNQMLMVLGSLVGASVGAASKVAAAGKVANSASERTMASLVKTAANNATKKTLSTAKLANDLKRTELTADTMKYAADVRASSMASAADIEQRYKDIEANRKAIENYLDKWRSKLE